MKRLDVPTFSTIVAQTPLVSIDLVLRNNAGKVLLGQRNNRPAQGMWFVPGGRILKDEKISDAFTRLTVEELGVDIPVENGRFLGVYEHFYPDNFTGEGFSTHYVVLGYQLTLELDLDRLPHEQHRAYHWWELQELLSSDDVHQHSKWYF